MYFNLFPEINYDITRTGNPILSVNLVKRFAPVQEVLNRATLYYDYKIRDGERPDIVSHKIYNTVDYDWLILMFNGMLDPYFDWPLAYDQFLSYLENKYGSFQASTQQIYQYQQIIVPGRILTDGTTIKEETLVVDQTTYTGLQADKRKILYAYDMEFANNEARRNIKVLDPVYIPQIDREVQKIFK